MSLSLCVVQSGIASQVPRIQDMGIQMKQMAKIAEMGQFLLLHTVRKMTIPIGKQMETFDIRFSSSMTVINAPVEKVKQVVTDFNHYHEFMPQTKWVEIISQTQDHIQAKFKLSIKIPLIRFGVKFVLDYYLEPSGDITWTQISGDMQGNIGRYEFVPLSENKTLLIFTFWSDIHDISFIMNLILKAQPDIELAIPVSTGALVVDSIKKRAENKPASTIPAIDQLNDKPDIPIMTSCQIPVPTLHKLSKLGTIVVVHPTQWIRDDAGNSIEVKFVSAGGMVQGPIDRVKALVSDFTRYHEFSYQVKKSVIRPTNDGMIVDWRLKLGFAIFKFNLDFSLDYDWENDNTLVFQCIDGDLEYNYGSWEWISLSENQTMVLFSTAIPLGKKAPFILKFTKMIPNSQVVMGASTTAVAIEKMSPWINEQIFLKK